MYLPRCHHITSETAFLCGLAFALLSAEFFSLPGPYRKPCTNQDRIRRELDVLCLMLVKEPFLFNPQLLATLLRAIFPFIRLGYIVRYAYDLYFGPKLCSPPTRFYHCCSNHISNMMRASLLLQSDISFAHLRKRLSRRPERDECGAPSPVPFVLATIYDDHYLSHLQTLKNSADNPICFPFKVVRSLHSDISTF